MKKVNFPDIGTYEIYINTIKTYGTKHDVKLISDSIIEHINAHHGKDEFNDHYLELCDEIYDAINKIILNTEPIFGSEFIKYIDSNTETI